MAKDTKKNKISRMKPAPLEGTPGASKTLTVPITQKASDNLIRIQGERQIRDGKRATIKSIATEILENAQ